MSQTRFLGFLFLGLVFLLPESQPRAQSTLTDSNAPIQFLADEMEYREAQNLMILSGNVQVTQNDLTVLSDRLHVYQSVQQESRSPDTASGAPGVDRLEAFGNVVVMSPTETAKGDEGQYDLLQETVTLVGRVTLEQDQNVLRGHMLIIDLKTGTSQLDARTTESGQKGRVQGVLRPSKQ